MLQVFKFNKNKGFMLLEIIIAIALITIAFTVLLSVMFSALNVSGSLQKQAKANFLVVEEFEAVRAFRDGTTWATNGLGITNVGNTNPYHMVNNSGVWSLVAGTETVDIFTRQVVFDKVSRDPATLNIDSVYNSGRDDADTRKITVTISWQDKSIQQVTYLTNWK
jgi:type II secretory pathway pseudopilin PulG